MNAPKAHGDDAAIASAVEGGLPEDSDADPEADALAIGRQGLLSSSKEDGQAKEKNDDRPWVKNVRNAYSYRLKESWLKETRRLVFVFPVQLR